MVDLKKKIKSLPTTPGIYLYKDENGVIIYVGKAVNLKRRVKQYFEPIDTLSPKTQQLVSHIASITTIKTVTEFDALLLEANCIRKYQPKYNIIAKDDKSPIYIEITRKEPLPRILLVRKPPKTTNSFIAGPFQSTRIAKSILRSMRRCIPYCTQKRRTGKPCFYTHIGLCDPCPSVIEKMAPSTAKTQRMKEYAWHIKQIIRILNGNIQPVVQELTDRMSFLAHEEKFEEAAIVRDRIGHMQQLLQTHFDPATYLHDMTAIGETVEEETRDLIEALHTTYPEIRTIHKIECVDISNTAGTKPVGSLVVMVDGIIDRAQYRRFEIHDIIGPNDTAMIGQVIQRRLRHPEWPFPDLLVIDGGKGQLHAAVLALQEAQISIPVIGLAKRYESIVVPKTATTSSITIHIRNDRPAIRLLTRIRDESHRFAITYHKHKRAKAFFEK